MTANLSGTGFRKRELLTREKTYSSVHCCIHNHWGIRVGRSQSSALYVHVFRFRYRRGFCQSRVSLPLASGEIQCFVCADGFAHGHRFLVFRRRGFPWFESLNQQTTHPGQQSPIRTSDLVSQCVPRSSGSSWTQ